MGLVTFVGADFTERHRDCVMFERMAASYGKVRPERLDKLRAEHPARLQWADIRPYDSINRMDGYCNRPVRLVFVVAWPRSVTSFFA